MCVCVYTLASVLPAPLSPEMRIDWLDFSEHIARYAELAMAYLHQA